MKILITGSSGQVGSSLIKYLASYKIIPISGKNCDLYNLKLLNKLIDIHQPDLIINTAAYTKVDLAEKEIELAYRLNVFLPEFLAKKALENDIPFIHFSTDYVFDGKKKDPYLESDLPNALSVYGSTKLKGEQAVTKIDGHYFIFRTSWVYSSTGKNFYLTIKNLIKNKEKIKVVNDQIGVPTSNYFLSYQINKLIPMLNKSNKGIYHLVPDGHSSWFEFAKTIIIYLKAEFNLRDLVPIKSDDLNFIARRPKNSILDNEKIKSTFMLEFDDWKTELERIINDA